MSLLQRVFSFLCLWRAFIPPPPLLWPRRLCDAAFTVVLGKTQSVDVMSLKSEVRMYCSLPRAQFWRIIICGWPAYSVAAQFQCLRPLSVALHTGITDAMLAWYPITQWKHTELSEQGTSVVYLVSHRNLLHKTQVLLHKTQVLIYKTRFWYIKPRFCYTKPRFCYTLSPDTIAPDWLT